MKKLLLAALLCGTAYAQIPAGVQSINGVPGPFTFTGAVSCSGTVCNFTGGGTVTNPLTFNVSGGAAPGLSFTGASAGAVDYHTVGALPVANPIFTGTLTGPAVSATGTCPFTGSPLGLGCVYVSAGSLAGVTGLAGTMGLLTDGVNPYVTIGNTSPVELLYQGIPSITLAASGSAPTLNTTGYLGTGISSNGTQIIFWIGGGNGGNVSAQGIGPNGYGVNNATYPLANGVALPGTGQYTWERSTPTVDTAFSSPSAGVISADTTTEGNGLASVNVGALTQVAANTYGGKCSMSTSTSCTITVGHTFTTPVCIATVQSATLTGAASGCSVSGTTVTVTAAVANSLTWGAFVFGDPN